jgi:hypothetical protein
MQLNKDKILDVGLENACGDMLIKEKNCKHYWCITCDINGKRWQEIPKSLYDEIVKFVEGK